MDEFAEFRKQVKSLLAHLLDTAYLEFHPLPPQLFDPLIGNRFSTRAQQTRSLIKENIEVLKPASDRSGSAVNVRVYQALNYRYVYGMSLIEIEHELGISQRQLQRELQKGIDGLSTLLWDRIQFFQETDKSPLEEITSNPLRDVLAEWEVNRQPVLLSSLLDRVFWTLHSFTAPKSDYRLYDPDILVDILILVDPTLAHLTLVKFFRIVLQRAETSNPSFTIQCKEDAVILSLHSSFSNQNENVEEWQEISMLLSQQGAVFSREIDNHSENIQVGFPLAGQKKIVIVDDNDGIQRLIQRYLTTQPYALVAVTDGTKALDSIRTEKPDAIILDLMIPLVDGWEILRGLVSNPETAKIPVIICSVLNETDLALSLGAKDFIRKPIDRPRLFAVLEKVLAPADSAGAVGLQSA